MKDFATRPDCCVVLGTFVLCILAQFPTSAQEQDDRGLSSRNSNFESSDNKQARREMVQFGVSLINKDRGKNKVEPLQQSPALSRLAQMYANYLLKSGFFDHVDPYGRSPQDRATLIGIDVSVSENLSWQSSDFEEPKILLARAQSQMMAEPRNQINHRSNILNPRSHFIGVGVAQAGDKVVMVQEFSEEERR